MTDVPLLAMAAVDLYAEGMDHPECIAFDCEGVMWAGGEAGQVYRIEPGGGKAQEIANIGGFCGGLAFSPADELFVCSVGVGVVRVEPSGRHALFADHAGSHRLVCPNYGLFDNRGQYVLSDSGGWRENTGCIVRFAPDGTGERIGGPYGYANGLALSADDRWLYMVETDSARVLRFAYDPEGPLSEPEVWAERVGRVPDGLALAENGDLYACSYASDDLWRIRPGREMSLVARDPESMLISGPTNICFGGRKFDELYVANLARTTVARVRLGLRGQPLANQRTALSTGAVR